MKNKEKKMKRALPIFSEKFNKHLLEKKKREDNLNEEKRKKEKFFDISNFKVNINNEVIKDINVIIDEKQKYIINKIANKTQNKSDYIEENNNEKEIDKEIEYNNESDFLKSDYPNEYIISKKKMKKRNMDEKNKLNKSINTISKNEKMKNENNLDDLINDPFIKMKELKLKFSNKYISKSGDLSNNILKEHHSIINNCINEIKHETFIEANLLKKDVENFILLIENDVKEIINLKWNKNEVDTLNKYTTKDNYYVAITYYENLMQDKIYETIMLHGKNADVIENTKKNLVNEMNKEIKEKLYKTKEKWIVIQNLFTQLNKSIKFFISNFEKKHELCVNLINKETLELEKKLKEKIFFTNKEISDLINKEIESNKSFFLEFLNCFNNYIMKIYNYVYMKYSEYESLFFNIFNEHKYQDNCYILSVISENYINNLPNNKVLNYLLKQFENNYDTMYKKRIELKKEEYFDNFFLKNYQDFYAYLNMYYEEYVKIYNEIKIKTVCFRDIVIYTFFNITNFATIINSHIEEKKEKKENNEKKSAHKRENNIRKENKIKEKVKNEDTKKEENTMYANNSETNFQEIKSMCILNTETTINNGENSFNTTTLMNSLDLTINYDNNNIKKSVKDDYTKQNNNIYRQDKENINHINKNKNMFEKCIENILNYYNIINLRDDFFFLSFFEFLEKLKNEALTLHSEIEKKIKNNNYFCEQESASLKEKFDSVFKEYNEIVKNCLRCKDYNEFNKLLILHEEMVKNLENLTKNINEKIDRINHNFLIELKGYSSNSFSSILKKSKIIISDEESKVNEKKTKKKENTGNEKENDRKIKEKENVDTRKNSKATREKENVDTRKNSKSIKEKKNIYMENEYKNSKKTNEINVEQIHLRNICDYNRENEINIINQILNTKYEYIYDISNIILLIYNNYIYNMKNILYNNSVYYDKYLKMEKKRIKKKGKVENYTTKQKNPIIKNIKFIKENIFLNIKENREYINEKQYNYEVNNDISDNIIITTFVGSINYDNLLFNLNNMRGAFEVFITKYYEYFKNNLFEFLLKIKMNIENQEYTKYFKRIEDDMYKEDIKKNTANIHKIKILLEKKFLKNKEIYNSYTQKLNELITEYVGIIKDCSLEKNFNSSLKKVDKLFLEKIDNYDDFNKKYILYFEKFKDNYNIVDEKLQNMINNLSKEIKKLEKYVEVIIKIKEKNVDIDTIKKDVHNSNIFLQSLIKKKKDVYDLYRANEYIFNNKIKIISKSDIIEMKSKVSTDKDMIKYLSVKEEIKNNILIFYILIFYMKTYILNNKFEKKKNENMIVSVSATPKVKEQKFKRNGSTYSMNSNNDKYLNTIKINIESKFKEIKNYIYNVSIFQKIKKIYELDIKKEDSILNNFLIFLKISENMNNLIFSKKHCMYEYKDNFINFHIYDENYDNKKEKKNSEENIRNGDNNFNNKSKQDGKNINNNRTNTGNHSNNDDANNHTVSYKEQKLLYKKEIKTIRTEHNNLEEKMDSPKHKIEKNRNMETNKKNIKVSEYKLIESLEDKENYIKNTIIRNYCDLKFILYICIYIIYLICKTIKIYNYNNFIENEEKYNHFLFISYDLSYSIYKNSILKENKLKNKICLKDLKLEKKSKSSFIYFPNHILYKIELTNLFNYEKKVFSDLFEKYFNQIKNLPSIEENNIKKLQNEYLNDILTIVIYLKILSRKTAYLIFSYVYKYHEELISERINYMQKNFKLKFQELSENFVITVEDYNLITKRKKEIKNLMELYVLCIKNILANHLYSFYENLYNNFIFIVQLINLLPSNFSFQPINLEEKCVSLKISTKENNEYNENTNTKIKGLENLLKIGYLDSSTKYDLSDLTKKIRKVYDLNNKCENENEKININNNVDKEVFYMGYFEDNSFIVKKLEKKIEKYMSKFYTYITKNLDEKKKEIIKMISNDKKLHRKYYE